MLNFLRRRRPEPATLPAGRRIYAIGDIHGRRDLFEQLLHQIETDNAARAPAEVSVILLGDLIDRGPDSAEVVRRAMAPLPWAATIALMGNHEATMLDALAGDRATLRLWMQNGGAAALSSWGVAPAILAEAPFETVVAHAAAAIAPAERSWLQRMRQWVRLGDYFFVHAGVRPGVPLDRQSHEDSLWIRQEFLDSTRDHGALIVHGHSVNLEVEERDNRIGIDTGAYRSGRLTALAIEGCERWLIQT